MLSKKKTDEQLSNAEKRKYSRVPLGGRVQFLTDGHVFDAKIVNISETGILLDSKVKIPLEHSLDIMIYLRGMQLIKTKVCVMRQCDLSKSKITNVGLGLAFCFLNCPYSLINQIQNHRKKIIDKYNVLIELSIGPMNEAKLKKIDYHCKTLFILGGPYQSIFDDSMMQNDLAPFRRQAIIDLAKMLV